MSVPADQALNPIAAAVQQGIRTADGVTEADQTTIDEVKELFDEYTVARTFDEETRKQYGRDRLYAQGIADMKWASDANIIGAFIDILVAFLYAKNPDVSARPAPQAGGFINPKMKQLAETLQIVVSRLWKDAKLKKRMRKIVRSSLSVGPGWIKVLMYDEKRPNPLLEKQLDDARDNLEKLRKIQEVVGEGGDPANDQQIREAERLMQGLQARVEKLVKRGLCVDFVRAEDMQVSLDVASIDDYVDADWVSNDLYIEKRHAASRFPDLTEGDIKNATEYHQLQTAPRYRAQSDESFGEVVPNEGQFAKAVDNPGLGGGGSVVMGGDQKPVKFIKVIELWCKRDNLIKTMIEGVKTWAREPYPPPQASTRFYPYFKLSFFEVDGARHPQSLSFRLAKMQDEYSAARSAGRLTRERSIPGILFDSGNISTDDATKIKDSVHAEYIPLKPAIQGKLSDNFAEKPIPKVDPRLFDTQPVQRDMEVLSGVQEAQQSTTQMANVTATAAEISQAGTAARTNADRDNLEDLLNDLAQYTAEISVQSLTVQDAQRYAGPLAFWPGEDEMNPNMVAMDVEDLLSLVQIEIEAGTTGKPREQQDKEAWATLMPVVERFLGLISQLQVANPPLAQAYRKLLGETLKRLDDRMSIDDILPPVDPAAVALPPTGDPNGAVDPAAAGAPPTDLPAAGNGTVNNPTTTQPPLA